MGIVATVVLDDVDVTQFCSGSVTRRLNRIGTASINMNMKKLTDEFGSAVAFPTAGSMLKVYFSGDVLGSAPVLWHHGRVLTREITAGKDTGYAVFNSSDPLELWHWRPVRDDDGDFSLPEVIANYVYAPQIIQAIFNNSEDTTAGGGGPPPTFAEGPLRMELSPPPAGTKPIIGFPSDWPMTMAEMASLLISTGVLDMVVTPIEFDVNDNYGQLDLYNGDYGTDRTASVTLSYGMGDFNVQSLRWNTDMTSMCNKLWTYLGPRRGTATDPAGDQHWNANITGDDPGLAYPPGGALSPPASPTNNPLGARNYASRNQYDVRMEVRVLDGLGDQVADDGRDLFRRLWQDESWLRAAPRELVHVTPVKDYGLGVFDIGDLITVEVNPDVAGGFGFTGGQRVYEYTASWDRDDSVVSMSELQVSSDNEGGDLSG